MDPINLLEKRITKSSLRAVARELDVSAGYLSHLMKGEREPGPKILDALGIEKVVTYRKKK
jgi:transcriptional regulator with XRE-family HTH domain